MYAVLRNPGSGATIRPLTAGDYESWLGLWDGNNLGTRNDQVTAQTWARLIDPDFPVRGIIAELDDKLAGLLHYVLHPTTGSLSNVCYMQDVYVDPAFRKKGIAKALLSELARCGKQEGWTRIYWLAEAQNEAAQGLYKNIGVKLNFTLHVMPV